MLGEILDVLGVNVAVVGSGDDTLGVVLVLDFHASELANVDIGAEVAAGGHSLLHAHVQIEGLVGLVLKIGKAGALLCRLRIPEVSLHTEAVALTEQQGGESVGHETLSLFLGVLSPIRHFSIF